MSYAIIDPIISGWATKHGLHLINKYQDAEVRAIHVSDSLGRTYRIGIEPPDKEGGIRVRACAWDFKKRNQLFDTNQTDLAGCLDRAIILLKGWMNDSN